MVGVVGVAAVGVRGEVHGARLYEAGVADGTLAAAGLRERGRGKDLRGREVLAGLGGTAAGGGEGESWRAGAGSVRAEEQKRRNWPTPWVCVLSFCPCRSSPSC